MKAAGIERLLRAFPLCTTFLAVSVVVASFTTASAQDVASDKLPYHADCGHLWNRLHEALFVRVGPDGRTYGQDRLDPLLWLHSAHLLEEPSHGRAVGVLEEFLQSDGEKLIVNPQKRAMLQRDLWLMFNWLDGDHGNFADPPLTPEAARAAQERLRGPLAAVIGRLALRAEAIRGLPDNYAAAVASGRFANRFDPDQPDQPYLPPELFADDGPWVCVGRTDGVTAPQHLREDGGNRFTNSVFLVFLRLPGGRAATLDYLRRLISFDEPLFVRNPDASSRRSFPLIPNAAISQFPQGTEAALVRRALLVDSSHRVAASPLTESVQLRIVHGELPALSPQVFNDALSGSAESRERVGAWQTFHEVRLSRRDLFANRGGGLRAVSRDERDFKTGFNAHPWDEFERPLREDQSFPDRNQQVGVRENCFACHSLPGVFSFNSLQDFRSGLSSGGDKVRPFPISPMSVEVITGVSVKRQAERASWKSLELLLSE